MQKTTEWLASFNSSYQEQIKSLVFERKLNQEKTTTIAITGGKGGVGKTSVSLKMAKVLAEQGFKTLLLDCDYNLSNTSIKLGLPVNNAFYSLLSSEKSFEDCIYKDNNFHLLSACNGSLNLFDSSFKLEEFIIDIIVEHEKEYDFILLDCPAGLSRETLTISAYCDKRIFVVTPDRASITDSYSLIKVLSHKFGIKENSLLVNMFTTKIQFERVVKTISETVENFLGCRTQILGGVKRLDIAPSLFDDFFLSGGKSVHHRNFLKVVSKITEELSRTQDEPSMYVGHPTELIEQEVRLFNA